MTDASTRDAKQERPHVAIQRISHELRTPLTVVIGFCELLQDNRADDHSIKEFARRISENAWLLLSAVERLVQELHIADYTGPPTADRFQCENGSSLDLPDLLFPADTEPAAAIESQSNEVIRSDGVGLANISS